MASLRPAFTQLRGRCQTSARQWQQPGLTLQGLQISPKARHTRPLSTNSHNTDDSVSKDRFAADTEQTREADRRAMLSKMIASLNARVDGEELEEQDPQTQERSQRETWGSPTMRDMFETGDFDREGPARSRATGPSEGAQREYRPQSGDRGGSNLMVSSDPFASSGAPEEAQQKKPKIYARAMPTSPSYFSRQPEFNDSYLVLQKLMRKNAHLPTAPSDQVKRVAFRKLEDYRLAVGEHVKASEYTRCMTLVKKLHKIHPDLKPPGVDDAIANFVRDINPHNQKPKEIPVDKFGRTLGVGKRKTSTARAWVVEGVGEVLVNGKSLADAFGRVHDRESAVWALKATARTDKYNVWALVEGGGTTGQAEALAMAVGKALMAHEPALKPALRRAGVVTRDPRGVERKKHGHLKARKKPAWVKR